MSNSSWVKKGKVSFFMRMLVGLMIVGVLSGCSKLVVLNPKGIIAAEERDMIFIAVGLMLIVVIPVFIMTFLFAYKYRASNLKAKYTPDWGHSTILEVIWWTVPCIIIIILGTLTWITSHRLDPYKPIESNTKPITIQVIALDWKWLFIYPEENIASVNYVQFPDHVPINFKITADAPMNSLWIPQLGGQIYAMSGMQTKLHLFATELGDYNGVSASFSGAGFSGMNFIARVTSADDYNSWVQTVHQSGARLSWESYNELVKPSEDHPVEYYASVEDNLYSDVMMKFMSPDMGNMSDMGHNNEVTESSHMENMKHHSM